MRRFGWLSRSATNSIARSCIAARWSTTAGRSSRWGVGGDALLALGPWLGLQLPADDRPPLPHRPLVLPLRPQETINVRFSDIPARTLLAPARLGESGERTRPARRPRTPRLSPCGGASWP